MYGIGGHYLNTYRCNIIMNKGEKCRFTIARLYPNDRAAIGKRSVAYTQIETEFLNNFSYSPLPFMGGGRGGVISLFGERLGEALPLLARESRCGFHFIALLFGISLTFS